jgi:uncharacterized protein YlaI
VKLTQFKDLLRAINRVGASQSVEKLAGELKTGFTDADLKDLVFGENGLFYVDELGLVTRVIVHIVDKGINHFEYKHKMAIEKGAFDNKGVIEKAHRYHLVNCKTLRQALAEGWREKYKMTQKENGHFYYRFLKDNKVYKKNNEQPLYVCYFCLQEINKKHNSSLQYDKFNFTPKVFFSDEFRGHWLVNSNYQVDSESIPNCYQQDWGEISKKYKAKVNYRCEEASCRYPDLSAPSLRKYLHCHHVNMDKSNNNFSNLKSVCLECHAKQPNHGHMQTAHYRQYVEKVNRLLAQA